jgi:hypothetical protein
VRLDRCNCPFHTDGVYRETRPRKSLRTRSWQVAERRLSELKRKIDAELNDQSGNEDAPQPMVRPHERTVSDAIERFLQSHVGPDSSALMAGPLSPPEPYVALPATEVISPSETLRIRSS